MSEVVILPSERISDYEDDNGNRIIGAPTWPGKSATVIFQGSNCTLEFGEGVNWDSLIMFKQDGGTLRVGDWCQTMGSVEIGRDSTVLMGHRLNISGAARIVTEDGATVRIGDDCLFAEDVSIRAYDHHPIFDLDTRRRINYARDIELGSDVWLGYGVTVLGGATIGHGSIVGTMSVVTSSSRIGEHCLAVGSPAKVKRERVAWCKPGDPPPDAMPADAHCDCALRLPVATEDP